MGTYRIDDGTVVKTENAKQTWEEALDWDGRNHISRATGQQWHHETLHCSRRGRYWIEHESNWQGEQARAEWIDNRRAAAWLLHNDHELPDDLKEIAAEVEE